LKVLLANTVALNGGDAAMMIAAHALVRRRLGADARVVVQDDRALVAHRYHPELSFRPRLLQHVGRGQRARIERLQLRLASRGWPVPLPAHARETLADWSTYDVVMSTGGTYLVDHYDLRPRGLELDLMSRGRAPLVLLPQTIGPLDKPVHRSALAPAFARARAVFTRDERSRNEAIDLGAPASVCRVCPDLAFALGRPEMLGAARRRTLPVGGLHVGISVRAWRHFRHGEAGRQAFESSMGRLAAHIVRSGGRVTFTSTCQGIPEYWADDAGVARRIVDRLPSDVSQSVEVDAAFASPLDRIAQWSKLDVFVSTRLHAAILALLGGTPVLPIEYERKTTDVFASIGHGEWVTSIDDLREVDLCDRFDRWLDGIDPARRGIFERVEEHVATTSEILDDVDLEPRP